MAGCMDSRTPTSYMAAAWITAWQSDIPARIASTSPRSPGIRSQPAVSNAVAFEGIRTNATTSSPRSLSFFAVCEPMKPVPPVRNTFIEVSDPGRSARRCIVVPRLLHNRGMSPRTRALVAASVLVLALACDEGKPTPDPSSAESPAVTAGETRCDNLAAAHERGTKLGGELRGDVTGDGFEDEIYLLQDEEGAPGCTALLFVEGEDVVLASE